jgi:hypothetical protein
MTLRVAVWGKRGSSDDPDQHLDAVKLIVEVAILAVHIIDLVRRSARL